MVNAWYMLIKFNEDCDWCCFHSLLSCSLPPVDIYFIILSYLVNLIDPFELS